MCPYKVTMQRQEHGKNTQEHVKNTKSRTRHHTKSPCQENYLSGPHLVFASSHHLDVQKVGTHSEHFKVAGK